VTGLGVAELQDDSLAPFDQAASALRIDCEQPVQRSGREDLSAPSRLSQPYTSRLRTDQTKPSYQ
jgi:hypothetical protein